jgi:HSP20 family molecular chaperone IbpA
MKKTILLILALILSSTMIEAKTIKMVIGEKELKEQKVKINKSYIIRKNHYIKDGKYIYELNVAGVKADDINLKITDDNTIVVTIKRIKPQNVTMKTNEIKYGIIKREILLPNENITKIKSELSNGILKIIAEK